MTSEAKSYLRKAEERLETARQLLRLGRHEDAISRAYYAVLSAARSALATEKLYPRTHEGTLKLFGEKLIKDRGLSTKLGAKFSRMKSLREAADYSPDFVSSDADAKWCVKAAAEFLNEVRDHLRTRGKSP